ncbi:MAG TPA: DUF3750 domain-containing protein [Ignavibacteria bacterium]|nr:DUF3750 domain-containing protein [Ignavibacteria bacterium]
MWVKKSEFDKLIDPEKFQVFILSSKVSFPFHFGIHTWIVISEKGKLHRWEVWRTKNNCKTSWGHVHKNMFKSYLWTKDWFFKKYFFKRKSRERFLWKVIEGGEGSNAERIIKFINKNASKYPLIHEYGFFFGPNSNTFTQWILDSSSETKVKLPFWAFGRNYKV